MNICKYCNSTFSDPKNKIPKSFCNRSCAAKFRYHILKKTGRKKIGKEIKCLNCENLIYIKPSQKDKKFCCCSCRAKFYSVGSRRKNGFNFECPICKNLKYTKPSSFNINKTGVKFCSRKCKQIAMKTGFTKWSFQKETKNFGSNPRKRIQVNKVRFYEHRKIMEEQLGRKLEKWEHVHHINEDPTDNRIENLMVLSNRQHGKIHKLKKTISS